MDLIFNVFIVSLCMTMLQLKFKCVGFGSAVEMTTGIEHFCQHNVQQVYLFIFH